MPTATLTVSLDGSNLEFSSTSTSVVTGEIDGNPVIGLIPPDASDTTFELTLTPGTGIASLNSVTAPVPFGLSETLLFSQGGNSILIFCFDVEAFWNSSFHFTLGYTTLVNTDVVVYEDPTIVFNPPSGSPAAQLEEAPVAAEPVMV